MTMSTSFPHCNDILGRRFLTRKEDPLVFGLRSALPPYISSAGKSSSSATAAATSSSSSFSRFSIRDVDKGQSAVFPARQTMPALFGRVAADFEEASHVVLRPCHESPDDLTDLPKLVESFLKFDVCEDTERLSDENVSLDTETEHRLRGLLRRGDRKVGGDDVCDDVRQVIRSEVEAACVVVAGDSCSDIFKCQLMFHLRERGLDAGFCKSKWKKTSGFPPGEYSFVDVEVHGVRYFVEADLSSQFETARCTEQYRLLLNMIPPVFVGRGDELKQLVRIVCSAQKRSMKKMDLHIPPWRRKGYMLFKWFGPQERTADQSQRDRGYISYYCREASSRHPDLG